MRVLAVPTSRKPEPRAKKQPARPHGGLRFRPSAPMGRISWSGRAADLVSVEALHDRPEGACHRTAVSRTSGSASERRRCGRTHPCPAASPLCLHRGRQEPARSAKRVTADNGSTGRGVGGRRGRTAVLELFVLHPEVVPLLVAKLLGRGGGRSAAAPAQFLHNGDVGAQGRSGRGGGAMAAHRTLVGTTAARPRLVLALAAHWRAERLAALRYSLERRAGRSSACAAPAGQHDRCAADSAPAPGGLPPPRRGALTRAVGTCRRALRAVAHRRTVSISPAARRSAAQSGPACCRMQANRAACTSKGISARLQILPLVAAFQTSTRM